MKITVENIWKQRSQDYFQESIGYWKLIGSSGLLGSTIILFILGVIYYPDFLEWLPQAFPVSFVLAIFLGWFITRASFRTLLQEADILFLTPVEKNMNLYFRQAVVYNTAIQITGLVLILMIFSPLYANKISDTESLWLFFLLPVLLKGWNLQSAWQTHRLQDGRKRNIHAVCRFSFHTLFLYWFFTGGSMGWLLIFALLLGGFYVIDKQSQSQNGFHWLHLIEMEKRLEGRFYRFASLFVDVPHLQSNVRNRQWLAFVTRFFPFTSASAYKYLYLKTFVRANEYLGIYIRLTIIGAVVVYWIPDLYGKVIAYTLFLFMMSIQIKALFLHHQHQFWFRLFPLPQTQLKKDFQWLNGLLLFVQSVIMYLPILWLEGSFLIVALPAIGLIYSFVYSSVYLSKVLKT